MRSYIYTGKSYLAKDAVYKLVKSMDDESNFRNDVTKKYLTKTL